MLLDAAAPLLVVQDLCVRYGSALRPTAALRDVSFTLARGEALGVIGETGSGKSTLARAVLGLVSPVSGSVTFAGERLTGLSSRRRRAFRRSGAVQYVFQDPLRSLDPDRTVAESIAEPLEIAGTASHGEIAARVRELADELDLDAKLLDQFPNALSGGQRQRAAIARALVMRPQVLILDEPVSALDAAHRAQVLELIARLHSQGMACLFISHDLGSVAGTTQRVLVLYRGRLVESAATADIVRKPVHPYTQLLVRSAPSLERSGLSRQERDALRAQLSLLAAAPPHGRGAARRRERTTS